MSISPDEALLLRQSILQKIEAKNREKTARADTPGPNEPAEGTEVSPKQTLRRPQRSTKDAPERLNRTLFLGNVPSQCCTSKQMQRELKAIFAAHGPVESLRFRSLVLAGPMPRKHAFISGQLSEQVDSVKAYVVMAKEEDAQKALLENMRVFHGHHMRVDSAGASSKLPSHKKSVFVGNIPLCASEEDLWTAFSDCGEITSVRVVRDKTTGIGKGFAYVAFGDRATVRSALLLDGSEIGGRKVRVQKCTQPGEHVKLDASKGDEARRRLDKADGGRFKYDGGRFKYDGKKSKYDGKKSKYDGERSKYDGKKSKYDDKTPTKCDDKNPTKYDDKTLTKSHGKTPTKPVSKGNKRRKMQ